MLRFEMLQESCESAEDAVVDLVDYCHRKLTLLAGRCARREIPTEDRTPHAEVLNTNTVQVKTKKREQCYKRNPWSIDNLVDMTVTELFLTYTGACTVHYSDQELFWKWLASIFWIFYSSEMWTVNYLLYYLCVYLLQGLQNQSTMLEFDISLKALSVLRYITDYVERSETYIFLWKKIQRVPKMYTYLKRCIVYSIVYVLLQMIKVELN